MPQDAVNLIRSAKELNVLLAGAKINKVTQPAADCAVLDVYCKNGNAKIEISANAVCPRVGFTSLERKNPAVAPNFCMLLRKHLINSSVKSVEVLGYERIIRIVFSGRNDFLEPVEKQLYCEIMGKYSNVILCENEIIAGTMKPAVVDLTKERALLCGMKYAPPKAQDKADLSCESEVIPALSAFSGGDLADFLFTRIKGLSLQTAREICYRVFGNFSIDKPLESPLNFYREILNFIYIENITPCTLTVNGKLSDCFFTDYLSAAGDKKYFGTIADAEESFFDGKIAARGKTELLNKLSSAVNSALKKERKKLQNVLEKQEAASGAEKERINGELIVANLYKIKRGDKTVTVYDYYNDNAERQIPLDPALSPNENAQKYFKKYAKLKNTLKAIAPQKVSAEAEIEYLESVAGEIRAAAEISDLAAIEEELKQTGVIKSDGEKQKIKKGDLKIPYRLFEFSGFKIRAGKNNLQNDKLTAIARPADLWLHVKNYHSAHVVIESNGGHIPEEIIKLAAEICAFYSEAEGGGKVEVDYTLKKYVKKPPQSKCGAAVYTDFKTILVEPDSHKNLEIQ